MPILTVPALAPEIADTWIFNKALLNVWLVVSSIFILPEETISDVEIVSLELYFLIIILDKWGYDPFTLWLPLKTHSVLNAFFGTNLSPNAKKVVGGGVVSEIFRETFTPFDSWIVFGDCGQNDGNRRNIPLTIFGDANADRTVLNEVLNIGLGCGFVEIHICLLFVLCSRFKY